jgi:hypothetical protein
MRICSCLRLSRRARRKCSLLLASRHSTARSFRRPGLTEKLLHVSVIRCQRLILSDKLTVITWTRGSTQFMDHIP